MKTDVVTTLIVLYLPVSVFATAPRFSTDVDLLILDDRKASSSLLRGTDSIELNNKSHQLVFRVEKTIHLSNSEERLYISLPLVVSFNAQLISQANFRLSCLENEREADHFNATPRPELLDGDLMPTPVKLDTLAITPTTGAIDYEVKVERYDKSAKRASPPQFTTVMTDDSALLSGVSELGAIPLQSRVFTERRLKYWFELADSQTRNTFL